MSGSAIRETPATDDVSCAASTFRPSTIRCRRVTLLGSPMNPGRPREECKNRWRHSRTAGSARSAGARIGTRIPGATAVTASRLVTLRFSRRFLSPPPRSHARLWHRRSAHPRLRRCEKPSLVSLRSPLPRHQRRCPGGLCHPYRASG